MKNIWGIDSTSTKQNDLALSVIGVEFINLQGKTFFLSCSSDDDVNMCFELDKHNISLSYIKSEGTLVYRVYDTDSTNNESTDSTVYYIHDNTEMIVDQNGNEHNLFGLSYKDSSYLISKIME